jgi:hypothetical protein
VPIELASVRANRHSRSLLGPGVPNIAWHDSLVRPTQEQRDAKSLAERLDALALAVSPLRLHGYLIPSRTDSRWHRSPLAVGIGPDGFGVAVWADRADAEQKLVTFHSGQAEPVRSQVVRTTLFPYFVQPLPGGEVLLVEGRSEPGFGAEVWSSQGELLRTGGLGDAIEHVLTTPEGSIWVGYFDEAMGGNGIGSHGLVRFGRDLGVEWVYPRDQGLPQVFDCEALNVDGETANCYSYTEFHLVTVTGTEALDRGHVPHGGARAIVLNGNRMAVVGGYGSHYDVIAPLLVTSTGIEPAGARRRLVLPNGLEVRDARMTSRGADLHVVIGTAWYRLGLDELA